MFFFYEMLMIVIALLKICFANDKSCSVGSMESKMVPLIGIFGSKDVKFSENKQEMDEWCRSLEGNSSSAKDYVRRCLKGSSKTLLSVAIFSSDKVQIKQSCNNKVMRNHFFSRAKCGNKGKQNTIKCWNKLIINLSNVKNVRDAKNRIPLLCCKFYEWKTCTINVYRNTGPPLCSEQIVEGLQQFLSRGSLDTLNIFCGDFDDESDKCEKLSKLLPKSRSNRPRNKTPFPAVFDIFDSL